MAPLAFKITYKYSADNTFRYIATGEFIGFKQLGVLCCVGENWLEARMRLLAKAKTVAQTYNTRPPVDELVDIDVEP